MSQRQNRQSVKGDDTKVDTKGNALPSYLVKGVDLKDYFWNPKTKEFLGRNAISWAKILVFYIAFYGFLAAYFAFMMTVFYSTLDDKRPTYTSKNDGSVMNAPGLSMRPQLTDKELIRQRFEYTPSNNGSYAEETESIAKLIQKYNDIKGKNAGKYEDCSDPKNQKPRSPRGKVCDFDLSTLNYTDPSGNWGYNTTSPYVILKLNRVFDWVPTVYNDKSDKLPEGLRKYIKENDAANLPMVWVWCTAEKGVESFTYFPQPGYPSYYYPFHNQDGYLAPLVAVSINNITVNEEVKVTCSAYAKNTKDQRLRFSFNVQEKNVE